MSTDLAQPIEQVLSPQEQRILSLLSDGVSVSQVATAIGVSDSRIAQLISDDYFAARLAERRFENLRKHNARDAVYDELEDKLLAQLKSAAPMIMQPEKIARVLQMVNQAKRRGSASPESIHEKQTVIRLQLPIQIVNRFSTNSQGQVTTVNSTEVTDVESIRAPRVSAPTTQSMVTVQSGQIKKMADAQAAESAIADAKIRELQNEYLRESRALQKFGFSETDD
jgi:hypothetical protein